MKILIVWILPVALFFIVRISFYSEGYDFWPYTIILMVLLVISSWITWRNAVDFSFLHLRTDLIWFGVLWLPALVAVNTTPEFFEEFWWFPIVSLLAMLVFWLVKSKSMIKGKLDNVKSKIKKEAAEPQAS